MSSLEELSARMDRLEASLGRLTDLLETRLAPPSSLETATQQASTALSDAHGSDTMSEQLSELMLQLGEPETLSSLTRIAALAPKLEYAAYFVAAGPELLEDVLHGANEQLTAQGLTAYDVKLRLDKATATLVDLSKGETLDVVRRMTGMAPSVMPLAEAASEAMAQRSAHEGEDELKERMTEAFLNLSDPETQEALIRIACLAPKLEYAAYFAAAGPELLEDVLETVQSKAAEEGIEMHVIKHRLSQATDLLFLYTGADQIEMIRQMGQRAPHLVPVLKASTQVFEQRAAIEGAEGLEDRLAESFLELTDPETLDALTRIAALAPKLEYAAYFAAAGPELLEEIIETVQKWAAERGVEGVDHRLQAGLDAMVTLSTPGTLRGLAGLGSVLATINDTENSVGALQRMVTRLPRLDRTLVQVERALDVIEDAVGDSGIGQFEELQKPAVTGLKLLGAANKPDTLAALETVIDLAPALARIAKPMMEKLAEVDPDTMAEALTLATSPETMDLLRMAHKRAPQLVPVLDALPMQPETLRFLQAANQATAKAVTEPVKPVGFWSLLGVLSDPDVQRTLGFGVSLSRNLSAQLDQHALPENK